MIRRVVIELFLLGLIIYFGVNYISTVRGYDPLESMGLVTVSTGGQKEARPPAAFEPTGARDIAEKNPFHPNRGAVPMATPLAAPPPVDVEPPPPPPLPVTLKGIVLGEQGERIAVIVEGDQRARLMREGDTLGEITVLSIEADRVKILRRSGELVLNLRELRTIDLDNEEGNP